MPPRDGVGLDDDNTTGPCRPRLAECHPEGSIDVLERWARSPFLLRRQLLQLAVLGVNLVGDGLLESLLPASLQQSRGL